MCCGCKKLQPISEFYKDKRATDGLESSCMECNKKRRNARRAKWSSWKTAKHNMARKKYRKQTLSKWRDVFLGIYGDFKCEICHKKLIFSLGGNGHSGIGDVVHFDHRLGGEFININPNSWLVDNKVCDVNINIFKECEFGMLCRSCNNSVGNVVNRIENMTIALSYVLNYRQVNKISTPVFENPIYRNKYGNYTNCYLERWHTVAALMYEDFNCECCGNELEFPSHGNGVRHGSVICFDHKTGHEPIKGSPRQWMEVHAVNDKNINIFYLSNLGVLCTYCNLMVGSPINREERLENALKYSRRGPI